MDRILRAYKLKRREMERNRKGEMRAAEDQEPPEDSSKRPKVPALARSAVFSALILIKD